jgi:preprotein translocase subunit YajC
VKSGQILLLVLPIAFVLLLFNAQRKRGRQVAQVQEQLAPGANVCTTSGLFGTVVSVTDTEVLIEAAPGVNLRFDRRAVGLVVTPTVDQPGDSPHIAPIHDDDPPEPTSS